MATVTIIARFSSATTTMFVVMAYHAAVSIHLVASGSDTGVITGEIGFFQSYRIDRMRAMTGVALDHGVGHF